MQADDKTYRIHINHVTRVEGHGSIRIDTHKGAVENVKLEIVEAHRFFESFVRGMLPHDVPQTVSRICGICCVGHQLAATKAVEAALGLEVSEQTLLLRKLFNQSQFLQSHALHVFFLAVPDYAGTQSILPLAQTQPEVVKRALRLKKLANDYTAVLGGRALHPMSPTLRGWRKLPDMAALEDLRGRLRAALGEMDAMVEFYRAGVKIPDYERETEYVCLHHPEEYALYDGQVMSSLGAISPVSEYRSVTNEFTVAHCTTKWSKWHRESYMVGALARVNNNHAQLHPQAREVADALGLRPICYNPYHNNTAQMVEMVHCLHDSIALIERILERGLTPEDIGYTPGPGRGVGATEVPRGILFHEYAFDDDGRCFDANAIIPTSQNINNVEQDMRAFVPKMLPKMQQDELALHMEMLLRAYDPCISCSVHMLDVEFV
ncbi:MAG: Ni/Fe hydrogenase subunit alpha [Ectothiorhodospiraceae bacterium]|jgi:coenzyme F420-reducing hydrogenase alpha subunit|nr:Ni/Fe hydrogenase subunit alpha [Ectothiorhodospiraceae bacterium]